MRSLIAFLIVCGTALIIARYRKKYRDFPPFIQAFLHSDILFVLIGVFIGPKLLQIVTHNDIVSMTPLIHMGLGFIGFISGSHLEWKRIRRFPKRFYAFSLFESVSTLMVVSCGVWFFMPILAPWESLWAGAKYTPVIIAGAIACSTTPRVLFLLAHNYKLNSQGFKLVQFSSTINGLPAILICGILFSVEKAVAYTSTGSNPIWFSYNLLVESFLWFFVSILIGVMTGGIFHYLVSGIHKENVIVSYILGIIAFISGISGQIALSPLFISTVAGITFANYSLKKEYVYGVLAHREHTVYILFLVLAGVLCEAVSGNVIWFALFLFIIRGLCKVFFGGIGLGLIRVKEKSKTNPFVTSLALVPLGGIPVAIAVSLVLNFAFPFSNQLFVAVLLLIFMNEAIQPILVKKIVKNG